jgi:hypothetical protein
MNARSWSVVSTDRGSPVARLATLDLPLRLTLLYLLLFPGVLWTERWPRVLLGAGGLLAPELARRPAFWGVAAFFCGLPLLEHWPRSDNHTYLVFYWCVALAACLGLRDAPAGVARSSRALVGLVFAFATAWKIWLSPDFVDGTFFRVSLMMDARFADLAVLLGGVSPADYAAHERWLDDLATGSASVLPVEESTRLRLLASGLTLWTLACEAAIALAFLWQGPRGPARWRDGVLLLFLGTTFAFATVPGFGCLLAVLGAAQVPADRPRARLLYVGAFFLVLGYRIVPWTSLLVSWE